MQSRNVIETHERAREFNEWQIPSPVGGERIDYSVHGSSCAFHNFVPNIFGFLYSALRHVFRRSGRSRLNRANGDGEG